MKTTLDALARLRQGYHLGGNPLAGRNAIPIKRRSFFQSKIKNQQSSLINLSLFLEN